MFRNQKMQRAIAALVLTTFTSLSLYPLTAAAQAKDAIEKAGLLPKQKDEGLIGNAKRYLNKMAGNRSPNTGSPADERFAKLLNDLHEDLKAVVPDTAMPREARLYGAEKNRDYDKTAPAAVAESGAMDTRAIGPNMRIETERRKPVPLKPLPGTDVAALVKSIRSKATEIKSLYAEIDQSFRSVEQHLKDAKLPQEILNRHKNAVAQYENRKAEFDGLMDKVERAPAGSNEQQAALADLGGFMAKYPNAKPHQYTNPNKLPFRTPDGKVRAPHESKDQYQAALFPPRYEKILLAGAIPDGLKVAQVTLPESPDASDMAETEDVQITKAIKEQAAALNKDPVKIYNWVRNHIEFIPSYGSIQGSDMTLKNKRGNAFDTASLLIALYRASGIPARYVYGTIEVPTDKVMNWVGGVTKSQAAQSLLGQGGIPNIAVVGGGTVKAIRLEHVWVEAYVDYSPSRGAVNKTPQTWVPMDASYKQYVFKQGMDIKNNVQLDPQKLLEQVTQGASVNEAEGYVQNLNEANLQNQIAAYQDRLKAYIDNQNPNATVRDVIGGKSITNEERPILLGSLPYRTIAIGNKFHTVPDHLRWKFKTNLYAGGWAGDSDSPFLELKRSTAQLAGKKITLSFVPATQADQDLIKSYMPKPHADGTPIQPSEMPSSLPGYLIKLKAEFRVDGQIVAQTVEIFTMGSDLRQANQYFNPGKGIWEGGDDNDISVGEYNAIGLNLQGIAVQQVQALRDRLEDTKTRLTKFQQNQNDTTPISNLTNDELAGDLVQTGILSYFANVDTNDALITRTLGNVVSYRLPSYGRFFTAAQPYYYFGTVRKVSFPAMVMDVDHLSHHGEAKDADRIVRTNFVQQIGISASAAEHAVPEAMFRNRDLPANHAAQPQGVSATKALAVAAANGQKIYTLNASNKPLHNQILQGLQISQDVKSEIANGLAAGKEVTVHEKDVTVNGWVGSGYTILDPDTGAGAYKIAGGANGGWLTLLAGATAGLLALVVGLVTLYVSVWLFMVLAVVFIAITIAAAIEGWDFKSYGRSLDVIGLAVALPMLAYLGIAGVIVGILALLAMIYIRLFALLPREETRYA